MLERSRFCGTQSGDVRSVAVLAIALAGCAASEPAAIVEPVQVRAPAPQPAIPDGKALAEEARALLGQAETDIQRARVKRALWSKAWESLLAARTALAANDNAMAITHARRASDLAQLGLEQLAYPALRQ
jgi:hypothetical protein